MTFISNTEFLLFVILIIKNNLSSPIYHKHATSLLLHINPFKILTYNLQMSLSFLCQELIFLSRRQMFVWKEEKHKGFFYIPYIIHRQHSQNPQIYTFSLSFVLWKHLCERKWRHKEVLSFEALCIWVKSLLHTLGLGNEGKRLIHLKNGMEGLKLEEVDKMLRRDGHEAAVRIVGCARVAAVLKHSGQPNSYQGSRGAETHAVTCDTGAGCSRC